MGSSEHFDAVVIGSGFGGSVMAYRLAEAGKTVCVLERGRRYPPGSFARSPRDMRTNFWDPTQEQLGLFQVWRFDGVDGLVAAGLGGGSLIYANVLIRKDENWFLRRHADGTEVEWPVTRADLETHYGNVEAILAPQRFPLESEPYSRTAKTLALRDAARRVGLHWELPNLGITFGDPAGSPVPGEPIRDPTGSTTNNLHGRTRSTCRLCGECDVGCNFGSKNTLDYNYLTLADRLGADLRDRCEVVSFGPRNRDGSTVPRTGDGYTVDYLDHAPGNAEGCRTEGRATTATVTCDRLVLSAGTFGSNHLLLKNRANFPLISGTLGTCFSGNGDLLGFIHGAHGDVGGRRTVRPLDPTKGSVITSTVRVDDVRDGGAGPGFYIQDGGYPGFVDWLVEAAWAGGALGRMLRVDGRRIEERILHHGAADQDLDRELESLIGSARHSSGILPVLGMGMDTPGGAFSLRPDGQLELDWTVDTSSDYFSRVINTMEDLATELGAEFMANPLWHLGKKVVTVHPLGGCAMGSDVHSGVVDSYGGVFGYPGFVIADGSVMPGPVGPNPSLTIAALADRFAEHLLDSWGPDPRPT